ncbi:hypothetical protein BDW62DRAFT_107481 [Aspergillus aurantiobrunneus]
MAANTTEPANGTAIKARINPYETNLELIPEDDPFRQRSPHYGRYLPRETDFRPRYHDWCQYDPEATVYWEDTVKSLWKPENSLHLEGTRQAFAAGSIIIRVDQEDATGAAAEKFSCLNANELSASRKAEDILRELEVAVPKLYFCGTVEGKNVTVESRIPGVSLDVAWRHLSAEQIELMKQQCRIVSERLSSTDAGPGHPSYVCSGLNSHLLSESGTLERDILFGENESHGSHPLVHNNMLLSNIIVDNHRIVGLAGWRYSGYFGFGRADKVHRQIRVPQLIAESAAGPNVHNVPKWADLYQGLQGTEPNGSADGNTTSAHPVKVEPSNTTLDKVPAEADVKPGMPQLDGTDTPEEHPTPKKIANLKNRGTSRASSSDRSSPANSTKAPAKRAAPGTKKGVGRKPTTKKRKLDDQDNESVDSRRSSPSSTRTSKTPGMKKQNSASLANSPAPEPKKRGRKKKKVEEEEEEEDDSDDDNEIFCICRKPDNHTWMIGCDGGCEDWFHGKCVNIHPRDAELIEKYICPNCKENGKGWTTWKPMCRLLECRKPARFTSKTPSKYCSDEHGLEFMRQKTQRLNVSTQPASQKPKSILKTALEGAHTPRDDDSEYDGSHIEDEKDDGMEDLGSRGGILTLGDLTAVIMGVESAEEFRKLGAHIVSPPPEEDVDTETKSEPDTEPKPSKKLGLDVGVDGLNYLPDEAEKIEKLRKQRDDLFHRRDMIAARNTFLNLVRQRSKSILELLKKKEPKGGWKDICGFDSRLAWSDEEFDEWRLSDIGKRVFEEGTPESLASSYPENVDADGDTAMDDLGSLSRGVCTKKRCERHKQWIKVQQQDSAFEERTLEEGLAECEKEAQGVVERAVLRMWAENGNVQNGAS